MTNMLASALQASAANVDTSQIEIDVNGAYETVSVIEYRSSEGTTIKDYFKRFDWALH